MPMLHTEAPDDASDATLVEQPGAPDESTASLADSDLSSAQPRDATGRFTRTPDGEEPRSDALPRETGDDGVASSDAQTQQDAGPQGEPFSYRADRAEHTIPGAEVFEDGSLYIPADQVAELRNLLAEGTAHRGSWRTYQEQQRQDFQQTLRAEQAKSQAMNAAALSMLELLQNPDRLAQFATDHEREFGHLRKELGLMLREHGIPLGGPRSTPAQPPATTNGTPLEQDMWATLEDEVLTVVSHDPAYRSLAASPEERQALLEHFNDTRGAYFVSQEGQVYLDRAKVKKVLDRELKRSQSVSNFAKAAQFNANGNAGTAGKKVPVPPAVTTRGSATPGDQESFNPKNRAEWERALGIR